jgi:AcrR family transcriptional regulator
MPLAHAGRRTWQQDPEGRRQRILEAAEVEVAKRGIHGLRTMAIARRAKVSEGTIFHLFGSKNALLSEMGYRYGDGLVRAAFGGVEPIEGDADVAAIIGAIFDYVDRNRALFAAFLWANDPTSGEVASAVREEMVNAIARQLANGVSQGVIPQLDSLAAAEIQYAMVEGTLRDCFVRHDGRDRERTERELVRSLRALLGQEAS